MVFWIGSYTRHKAQGPILVLGPRPILVVGLGLIPVVGPRHLKTILYFMGSPSKVLISKFIGRFCFRIVKVMFCFQRLKLIFTSGAIQVRFCFQHLKLIFTSKEVKIWLDFKRLK